MGKLWSFLTGYVILITHNHLLFSFLSSDEPIKVSNMLKLFKLDPTKDSFTFFFPEEFTLMLGLKFCTKNYNLCNAYKIVLRYAKLKVFFFVQAFPY